MLCGPIGLRTGSFSHLRRSLLPAAWIACASQLNIGLLPLLRDEHPDVQLIAAGFAYDVEPLVCRAVLEQLTTSMSAVGLSAWAMLAYKNPDDPPDPKLIGSSSSSDSDDDKPES